jgi:L-fuculose-phosphate aldolase
MKGPDKSLAEMPLAASTVPSPSEAFLRSELLTISQKLDTLGLNRGTSGNVSACVSSDYWLITPSGVPVDKLSAEAMVLMDFEGKPATDGKPSSEWRFHYDILKARPEVGAVVHTHSRFATAFSCLKLDIPAFHYMIAAAGGDSIRCCPYALFGSQTLSDQVLIALKDRKACLLGNHGMIAVGKDLTTALALAVEVESLCEQYWTALQLGQPNILSSSQMAEVLEKFKTYGQLRSAE